jgi:hypothetical protein
MRIWARSRQPAVEHAALCRTYDALQMMRASSRICFRLFAVLPPPVVGVFALLLFSHVDDVDLASPASIIAATMHILPPIAVVGLGAYPFEVHEAQNGPTL